MSEIKEILSKYKKIALIGVSNDPTKASTIVMKYMQKYGFKVFPINPKAKGQKILGEKVFEKIKKSKLSSYYPLYPIQKFLKNHLNQRFLMFYKLIYIILRIFRVHL